ncbi:hypothetical protein [Nocardia otitidiscaviarum]|uniref:hypothetical protein n=1 Tax=Nocardia otitidiscaviarum TaxID=1823 RepID=UPI000693A1C5|nr:hypothetical protein [Nocardia otitidiscaviarum]
MIPRTRRAALLSILEFERKVKDLAIQAYSQWLPIARAAVLGENLTAAADDEVPPGPPPEPEAIALTEADWESILAAVFMTGLAELLWAQMTAEMIELGITVPDLRTLIPDNDDDEDQPRPRRRRGARPPRDTGRPPTDDREPDDREPDDEDPDEDRDEEAPDREPDDEPDRDRDRDREPDDDEELTPQFVARVPTVQEWVEAYLASVHNRMVRTPDTAFDLIRAELIEATRDGESIQEQRARVARVLDAENLDTFGGRRAALVARTETAGALNGARLESARVMAEITGEELHKVWLCVTGDTRVSARHVRTAARRHYEGPLVTVRTASGLAVSLTPQHRVLTTRGWLPAKHVDQSDYLFHVGGADPTRAPRVEDSVPRIGEVVDAAMASGPVQVWPVVAAVDFDRDTVNGDIHVVPADGELMHRIEPGVGQGGDDLLLTDADRLGEVAMFAVRNPDSGQRTHRPPEGLRRYLRVPGALRRWILARIGQLPGFTPIPALDTVHLQDRGDARGRTGVRGRDHLGGLANLIAGDDLGIRDIIATPGGDAKLLRRPRLFGARRVPVEEVADRGSGLEQHASIAKTSADRFSAHATERSGDVGGSDTCPVHGRGTVDVETNVLAALHFHPRLSQPTAKYCVADRQVRRDGGEGFARAVAVSDCVDIDRDPGRGAAPAAGVDAVGVESAAHGLPGGVVSVGDALERFASGMAADRVVDVEHGWHVGHVYDLETVSGWYMANGLIVHNCTIDNRTRATHFAADGQRQPLDGEFTMASGATLRWPGDPTAPAAEVCNCRCALMILAVDEELPAEDDRHTERGPGDATVRNREGRTRAEEIERRREEEGITRARDDPNGVGEITAAAPPPERIRPMLTFTATLAHLGVMTDDRRMLAADMDLRFAATPMPLMWQERTAPGHDGAVAVGVVDTIELVDGQVEATGHFLDTEDAAKALVQIREGITNPSIDPADVEWELRDESGEVITDFEQIGFSDRITEVYTAAIVRAATLVNIPAFGTTTISLTETDTEQVDDLDIDELMAASGYGPALTAATAARFRPDGTLFADPGFGEPTPLHITDDGRVQGHLAVFGSCHVGRTDRCVTPPHSATGYAHFHVSSVQTADGTWLPVGRLTVGGGHADDSLGARAAAEHYDNTSSCWAYVRAGEDAHGIWVSGVLHPDATDAQVRDGLSAPLSGDWRRIGGNLELVAALSVNTPGFPVLRGRDDEHGRTTALVAALGPRRRDSADTILLREVARETVREYVAHTRRQTALHLIQQRRRAQAAALVAAINSRKG